ncbi:ATP-binding protein [Parabacteroides sp. AF17-28]|uniref:ATP-binding protein n=1 Tax=Parabacteroides sp. AF17-28 TaxID=2292241 RepID=UPI000F000952|nr:ATP-binding protein [Parabacteroides sp. AF17-28]RHR60766.1 AAA family ATPase [Parabacteroides sp. AF17-28]
MSNKIYPIGVQNFEKIRRDGYFYVDKTAHVYQLAKSGSYYFLSRPRRFGKSLLLSTLEAYFEGKKELFAGLAIERLEKDWKCYPVLHLDLNARQYENIGSLLEELNKYLEIWEQAYDSPFGDRKPEERFFQVIRRAYEKTGQRVVVLIDEYDKPLLQAIGKPELQEAYRSLLKAFYGVMKSADGYIRFAMLTGVTKFSKVSVFSDLNNLEDISFRRNYNELCGISEQELQDNLGDELPEFSRSLGLTESELCDKLRRYYDGYHFAPDTAVGIYNPFSLLHAFKNREFDSYWFATGTPSYLVELLKRNHYDLDRLAHEETDAETLDGVDSVDSDPIPVIYQSGYLTIKGYDAEFGMYRLGFPNLEVEEGFVKYLLPFYTNVSASKTPFEISRFIREIRSGDYDAFFRRLQGFFADTPYETVTGLKPERDTELHYQNVLFIVFRLIGLYTKVEYHTNRGRIDLVLQTDRYIYVMEFKLNGTAEEALHQINEKQYGQAFAADGRQIIKIGVNFSSETRNIEKWVVS